jgi:hypothetical protein
MELQDPKYIETPLNNLNKNIDQKHTDVMKALIETKSAGNIRESPHTGTRPKHSLLGTTQQIQKKLHCTSCTETRNSEATLVAHLRCHEEDGDYACNNCSYKSNDKSNLRNHTRQTKHISADLEYICVYCKTELKSSKELKSHKETHRPEGAPTNRCELCEYEFQTRVDLRQHMRIAHGVLRKVWNNMSTETSTVAQRTEENLEQGRIDVINEEEQGNKPCNICGTMINNKQAITLNMKVQHFSHKPCRNISINDANSCASK